MKKRHLGVPVMRGSVPGQCRSKTVIGTKVMQKASFQAGANTTKTPPARARCGVSAKKSGFCGERPTNQNGGGVSGGV
jgi:hypothetical protein|tara:strand:- start:6 stop:239 length:234 start_codon:yes stop_codon:yes gene_type:complete